MRHQTRFTAAAAAVSISALLLAGLPLHAQKGKAKNQAEIDRFLARDQKKITAAKARVKKRFSPALIKVFGLSETLLEDRSSREASKRYPTASQNVMERITLKRKLEHKYQAQLRKNWQLSYDEWIALLGLSSSY